MSEEHVNIRTKDTQTIHYPFMPPEGTIHYVPATDQYMYAARTYAQEY